MALLLASGCAEIEPKPFEPSRGHIQSDESAEPAANIPALVQQAPILPEPSPPAPTERYTVVVNEVPVRELLFALARDAEMNIDIYPGIAGEVTLNAVDQTLPQILDRISRQADIRYEFDDQNLYISPDSPFFRSYKVNYVNMSRDTTSSNRLATQISTTGGDGGIGGQGGGGAQGGGGQGSNNSTTDIESISNNRFWQTLTQNIQALVGDDVATGQSAELPVSANVIPSPETGVINVRATNKQHEFVRAHIDRVIESAQRQVMIQATIVEVSLSDEYQAGIDWSALDIFDSSISIASSLATVPIPADTNRLLTLTYSGTDVSAAIRLLEQFGTTNVLSSPQLMAMNNQTALLKVVENFVYFEIETDIVTSQTTSNTTVETTPRVVPVGIVMSITPQISETDAVILNVRPTISRIAELKQDPGPALFQSLNPNIGQLAEIVNEVPQIEIREMESMLRLNNGQTAVLGGLMQNQERDVTDSVPGFSRLPLVGRAFRADTRQFSKSELVIFLRPVVVRSPSINDDLQEYRQFLNTSALQPGVAQP
ncbi:MAG: secretin N-terminal domain-containing protein [Gammaproteobacteria bacterium]